MTEYKNDDTISVWTTEPKGTVVGSGYVFFGEKRHNVIVVSDTTKTGKDINRVFVDIGAVFENTKKTSEKSPDFTGKFEYPDTGKSQIALWTRTSNSGGQFLSGQLSEPMKKEGDAKPATGNGMFGKKAAPAPADDDLDDDVPF